jgi:hypothetical protein
LVSDIPAGDGKTANSFLQCRKRDTLLLKVEPLDVGEGILSFRRKAVESTHCKQGNPQL